MDLMQLHPKAADDGGDLLRTMEPRDASEEDGYYSTTDMPTELVRAALLRCRVLCSLCAALLRVPRVLCVLRVLRVLRAACCVSCVRRPVCRVAPPLQATQHACCPAHVRP
jgi:hypothetical protein